MSSDKIMKKWRVVGWASIACFCIVAIAIQAVFGGGMGLGIAPEEVEVAQGSTITYDITVYNYQDTPDLFDVFVLPGSCDRSWFSWTTNQTDIVPADRGQKRVLLDVTPTKTGNYTFTVRAVSKSDCASQTASISVNNTKKPDLIITDIWDVGTSVVHYEIKNIGTATTTKSSKTALFVDGNFEKDDPVSKGLAPGESVKRNFTNYDWTTSCTPQHDVVIIKVCADNNDDIDELDESNNCMEKLFNCYNYPPVCACLMPDKNSPQQLVDGLKITWNASAFDPEGDTLEYRFLLSGPGTGHNFTVVQDWRNAPYPECPTWTWIPDFDNRGNNYIKVEIRDGKYVPYPNYSDVNATYPKYWIGPAE